MKKLNSKILREYEPSSEEVAAIPRNPIVFVLDEILDTFNIGSMFRLADAVAAEKMYLCGRMETPPSSRIHKAAVGTERWVPWEHSPSTIEAVEQLKTQGFKIVAAEQSKRSVALTEFEPPFPLAIVLGHESDGVKKEILQIADVTVELPMLGVNNSFNVWGTAAVLAYKAIESLQAHQEGVGLSK